MDWLNFVSGIVGVLFGGGVMFWRQNRTAKIIANESALSAEWEKLYREQMDARLRNEERIRELAARVQELEKKVQAYELEFEQIKFKESKKSEKV